MGRVSLLKISGRDYLLTLIALFVLACGGEEKQAEPEPEVQVEEPAPPVELLPTAVDSTAIYQDTVKYTTNADGYIKLTWRHLAEVDFEERYTEEVETYVPYPVFRPSVQRLSGKKVEIKGYIIPVEETGEESIIVLSANPFSSCFFCGMAGPETIMDIKLKKKFKNRFKQDDVLTFRGKLRLNDSDLYYLNYILEEAELK